MRTESGFSLLEILVVLALTAVLLTLGLAGHRHARSAADRAAALQCARDLLDFEHAAYLDEGRFLAPDEVLAGEDPPRCLARSCPDGTRCRFLWPWRLETEVAEDHFRLVLTREASLPAKIEAALDENGPFQLSVRP